ncbi:uncharacterized protein [Physcomitrium patens]|uniref:Smr domain-containing protein n=1 Tax=Physcomitrium patens TaxID=3218 RepID=A0A7I4F3P8_PHYPA|nr:pentatricopeptide repeat-containing protein At1g74850, chloroplastic-like isoform X2 [Physcomitrium patens]|eukprot:XP_024394380.1 pentatricopeptide repeat-containing protein At1g74850, chloroplastic-like isoform X2 [Physcomitrella patens]
MAFVAEAGHGRLSLTGVHYSNTRCNTDLNIQSCAVKGRFGIEISQHIMRHLNNVSVPRDLPVSLWPETTPVLATKRIQYLTVKCANSSEKSFQPAETSTKLASEFSRDQLPGKQFQSARKPRSPSLSAPSVPLLDKAPGKARPGQYSKLASREVQGSPGACEQPSRTRSYFSKGPESSLSGLSESKLWSMLNDCSKQRNWRVALDVFAAMKQAEGFKANIRIYSRMIRILAKANQPQRALQLFDEMKSVGFDPDVYVFTALLDAYGRAGMLEKAVSVFQKMKETPSCKPNATTYGCMMAAHGRARQWEKIDALFSEMVALDLKLSGPIFNVVIGAYGKGGLWNKMEEALDAMIAAGCQGDILTYSSLIHAYRKGGQFEKMDKILEQMQLAGCKPDVTAYSLLIDVYGKRGMLKKMEATLQEMQEAGCKANIVTYTGMLDAYGKAGKYEEMERVWKIMKDLNLQPDYSAFVATISAYGRCGLYDKMEARFQELEEAAKEMPFGGPRLGTAAYNVIIDAYGKGKLIDQMESAHEAMQNTGYRPDVITYSALINAYGKAELLEKMDSTYVMMRVKGVFPNEHTYSALIDGYGKLGMVGKAEAVLDEMLKAGIKMNVVAYTSIINAYGSAKRFQDMAVRFSALKEAGTEPSCETIGVLLTALCSCRLLEDVSALLNCIRNCEGFGVIAWLLEESAESLGDKFLWVEATVLFDALQSEGTASRLVLYDSLVEALWCFGWRGRAWKVLMAGRERDVFPQARVVADEELLLDLHLLSVNVAQVMLVSWLSEMESTCIKEDTPYEQVTVITGWGRRSKIEGDSPLKAAVTARLVSMNSPFRIPRENAGRLVAPVDQVCRWLSTERLSSHLSLEDVGVPGPSHLIPTV